jgi:hypothetical protein
MDRTIGLEKEFDHLLSADHDDTSGKDEKDTFDDVQASDNTPVTKFLVAAKGTFDTLHGLFQVFNGCCDVLELLLSSKARRGGKVTLGLIIGAFGAHLASSFGRDCW